MALLYGSTIYPLVARELRGLRGAARTIPDPVLRRLALASLRKRGNMEGAAMFAVLAPRAQRRTAVRALVAFQAIYNYLDILAEQASGDPPANGRRLHQALLTALDPLASHPDYYALNPRREDGGYLIDTLEACRDALAKLPSFPLVAGFAHESAARIVEFQALNLAPPQGPDDALERWARDETAPGSGLCWWETAAAGGSSLGVHVMIGLAADPDLDIHSLRSVADAYFPWIGALHSLLDSTVDIDEDRRENQRNLLAYYASPALAARRVEYLAARATSQSRGLSGGDRHLAVLTAMVSYYLSTPQASAREARVVSSGVIAGSGSLTQPVLALFRGWRRISHRWRGER